jgi:hypothetical protein
VIGGKQQSGGRGQRTAGRIGQRGVIGAPKEQTKGPKGERAGFTSGGSGLVRDNGDEHHIPHHDTQNNDQAEGWYHQETDNVVPPEHQHRLPHAPPATD